MLLVRLSERLGVGAIIDEVLPRDERELLRDPALNGGAGRGTVLVEVSDFRDASDAFDGMGDGRLVSCSRPWVLSIFGSPPPMFEGGDEPLIVAVDRRFAIFCASFADTGNTTPSAFKLKRENFGGAAEESQLSSGSREVEGPVECPTYMDCRFGFLPPGEVEGRRAEAGRERSKRSAVGDDLERVEEGSAHTGISGTGGGGLNDRGWEAFFEERVEADLEGREGSGASFTNPQESRRDRLTGSGSVGVGGSVGATLVSLASGGSEVGLVEDEPEGGPYIDVGRENTLTTSGLELILFGLYLGLASWLREEPDSSLPVRVPSSTIEGPARGEERNGRTSRRGDEGRYIVCRRDGSTREGVFVRK